MNNNLRDWDELHDQDTHGQGPSLFVRKNHHSISTLNAENARFQAENNNIEIVLNLAERKQVHFTEFRTLSLKGTEMLYNLIARKLQEVIDGSVD